MILLTAKVVVRDRNGGIRYFFDVPEYETKGMFDWTDHFPPDAPTPEEGDIIQAHIYTKDSDVSDTMRMRMFVEGYFGEDPKWEIGMQNESG